MTDPVANDDPIVRVKDAPAFLGVGKRTLYDLRDRGDLPPPLSLGHKCKGWRRSTLEAFLAGATPPPPPPPGRSELIRRLQTLVSGMESAAEELREAAFAPESTPTGIDLIYAIGKFSGDFYRAYGKAGFALPVEDLYEGEEETNG